MSGSSSASQSRKFNWQPWVPVLKVLVQITAVVTGVVAVISLVVNLWGINQSLKERKIRDWQQVVVFSIIEKAGNAGISFDMIKTSYIQEAQIAKDVDIPKDSIQEGALRLVLMNLLSNQLVFATPEGRYVKWLTIPKMRLEKRTLYDSVQDKIVETVLKKPGKYSPEELHTQVLAPDRDVSLFEFYMILEGGLRAGAIYYDKNGKLWHVTTPLPPSK